MVEKNRQLRGGMELYHFTNEEALRFLEHIGRVDLSDLKRVHDFACSALIFPDKVTAFEALVKDAGLPITSPDQKDPTSPLH